ncbi:hypothetical protein CH373_01395 [Leptospira perolatii]|uniref:HTH araC/xylS-type domain-containing protein n=1 Tax=Leptospira perolatii TaxID=2023191 RepID=A0A2M9ZRY3_9LEPT|nr:helix-turn-helix domain-containing protein [Leptospira perolatii]PJZ71196.1 hypothetical protein CH360_01395 [Leptospira perolatii]PJZ74729.1 hypothetical protein CH373_01395 [Leptospira perolatii]
MGGLELFTTILRFVGASQLFVLAVYFLRMGWPGRCAAFFNFTLCCYLIIPPFLSTEAWFYLQFPILFGAFGVAVSFWIFALSIFDDSFSVTVQHVVSLLLVEALSFFLYLIKDIALPEFILPIRRLFPQLINLGFIVFTLIHVHRGAAGDLIEERRKFRRLFVIVSGIYILLVLAVEIGLKGLQAPAILNTANVVSVVALVFYFSFRILTPRPRTFLDQPSAPATDAERSLSQKIHALMETEKVFTRDDLSPRSLASLLDEQEYKVRRAINGAMGYRNFFDFLNHYRIEEACLILSDASKRTVPIVRIAMDCGYASLAPFNRAFKELKETSPTDFRKKALR